MMRQGPRELQLQVCLGPGLLQPDVVRGLAQRGAGLFRISLAQVALASLERTVGMIRSQCEVPVCIDSEGGGARCGMVAAGAVLRPAATVRLTPEKVLGGVRAISLRPASLFATLAEGAVVRIEPDVIARVARVGGDGALAVVVEGGPVESNAVVTIEPPPVMPSALTDKDRAAVAIGMRLGVDHYGLSCAASAEEVRSLRLLAPRARIIATIATGAGYGHREEIAGAADGVLVDRRGLAREFPVEQVPHCQREIVTRAERAGVPALVDVSLSRPAEGPFPSVAEAGDIAGSLLGGAGGLVLRPGTDPVGALDAASRCLTAFAAQQAELGSSLTSLGRS